MVKNLDTKVVLKQTVLHGSMRPEILQRVATVYIDGAEYRVSAPPEAKGDALEWVPHFVVRQLVDLNAEIEIHDAYGVLALKVVKEELEKQKHSTETIVEEPSEVEPKGNLRHGSTPARSVENVEVAIPRKREQVSPKGALDYLSPASFIAAAQAADPTFKFAIVIAGLLAIVVTFAKFGVSFVTLIFGAVVLIGLMILYFVFAQIAQLAKAKMDLPARVLVWAVLVIVIAVLIGLTTSAFLNAPLPVRDWIVERLGTTRTTSTPSDTGRPEGTSSTNPGAPVEDKFAAERSIILAELTDAYKATAYKMAYMEDWGQPNTRPSMRVKDGVMSATSADAKRTVSISIDPRLLPVPKHYEAYVNQLSNLGSKQSSRIVGFFEEYDQFKVALDKLNSNPVDLNMALINATTTARETVTRGRLALCTMGTIPPRLFDGTVPEPMPLDCKVSPFSSTLITDLPDQEQ